jgi:hypothetical protein
MAQIFHPSDNTIARFTIYAAAFLLAALAWTCVSLDRSSYNTGQGIIRSQPVQFSHEHHVSGLGIDCRFCHTSVETAANAGMPPTSTCYGCHQIVWARSPELAPVRESARTGVSLQWTRVHDLPDFTYFDHSIHVAKGVGCASCHGPVHRMQLVYQATPLKMEWSLDCHRNPAPHIRPKEAVFDMDYEADDQTTLGPRLAAAYHVRDPFTLTNCSTCHR